MIRSKIISLIHEDSFFSFKNRETSYKRPCRGCNRFFDTIESLTAKSDKTSLYKRSFPMTIKTKEKSLQQ
jgi:hypothetical protein